MASPQALLVTRPEPGASDLIRTLQSQVAAELFSAPLTTIVATHAAIDKGDADVLLITSPKAIELAETLPALPVVAVGRTSSEAAKARGLDVRAIGSSRIDDALIDTIKPGMRVLHLAGADLSTDPAPLFAERGIAYRRTVVYEAQAASEAPADLSRFLAFSGDRFVTFLSARAAEIFGQLAAPLAPSAGKPSLAALCLSPRIAEAAAATELFENVQSSPTSEPAQFVDFIKSHCT